ncbi:MAG TPA: FliA/WhiG family RNA polymerase sigma factor [Fimbriimonadales bacterium]|nr:FliA/WhiG family RNA polymerase sigma factor [Fimbriimonadales bacterium]
MTNLTREQLGRLWKAYKENGDLEARNQIIQNFAHLVKITTGRVVTSTPNGIDREDLISAGMIGLIKAVDQFDPNRDVKFETYAIALIRGAVLEMLRGEDWVPRSVREKIRALQRTIMDYEAKNGKPPSDEQIADLMGLTQDELQILYQQEARSGLLSLDDIFTGTDAEEHLHFAELIIDENSAPDAEAEGREARRILAKGIDKLPERERLVIALYYYEGLTFKEIGQVLGVSESRVYQLHTQAMLRIRTYMQTQGGIYATP